MGTKKKHSWVEVVAAAITIQRAYKRYKARKAKEQDELPDLKCKDVAMATVKIQGAYKGFKARKAAKAAQYGTPSTTKSVARHPPEHKFPKPVRVAPAARPPPAHKFPK